MREALLGPRGAAGAVGGIPATARPMAAGRGGARRGFNPAGPGRGRAGRGARSGAASLRLPAAAAGGGCAGAALGAAGNGGRRRGAGEAAGAEVAALLCRAPLPSPGLAALPWAGLVPGRAGPRAGAQEPLARAGCGS